MVKKQVFNLKVKREDINVLQRYSYEIAMLTNRLDVLTENHLDDETFFDSQVYKRLTQELIDKQMEYEHKKEELILPYIPQNFKNAEHNWNLDFSTAELTIY